MTRLDDVARVVGDIPYMSLEQAGLMDSLISENGYARILELGFHHGVSTCYLAAAVDRFEHGNVVTVDLASAQRLSPNVEELLARLGLQERVTVHYEPTSYLWRLMRLLEPPAATFDLCYIDGAHDWFTDGFAFLLVDRLLAPGGAIVFDDLDWTFSTSPALASSPRVHAMPEDERTTPQIRKVWELLVKTHPDYGQFEERDGWAIARKSASAGGSGPDEVRTEIVYRERRVGLGALLSRVAERIRSRS